MKPQSRKAMKTPILAAAFAVVILSGCTYVEPVDDTDTTTTTTTTTDHMTGEQVVTEETTTTYR